jgi:rubrerythrin
MKTIEDFLARALAIGAEATASYQLLAEQMQVHNHRDAAGVFRGLARMEMGRHDELLERAAGRVLPAVMPWDCQWLDSAGRDPLPLDWARRPMTAHHALRVALANEERSRRFFEQCAASPACSDEVRRMARKFADEEDGHIARLERVLGQAARSIGGAAQGRAASG